MSVYDNCDQEYIHHDDISPFCANLLEKRTFEYEIENSWNPSQDSLKRDANPLDDELSYYNLIYFKSSNEPTKNEERRILKRSEDVSSSNTTLENDKNATLVESVAEAITNDLKKIKSIFVNPPEAELGSDGWPDKLIYDPSKDETYWWRNDPVLNLFHEHWHLVMTSSNIGGTAKDREGENFIYMHRFMLARYDAERIAVGIGTVIPLPDYRTPIPEPFYPPPYLFTDLDGDKVPFPARPPNQTFRDIFRLVSDESSITTVKNLENMLYKLEQWLDGETNSEYPDKLQFVDSEANLLGQEIEQGLHNVGHMMLSYIMHPYAVGYAPSVLVGARAGTRDQLFWRWHRHIDNIFDKWQTKLGPSDFHHDAPNVTIKHTDIFLVFTDVLLDASVTTDLDFLEFGKLTFGGENFEKDLSNNSYVTDVLYTKMKNRTLVWREDLYEEENITYLYPRDWQYFFRVRNDVNVTSIVTFRIFIVPEELANSHVHWIELDKFKKSLAPFEKTVVVRSCDKSIIIRKPAQKTEEQLDEIQITPELTNRMVRLTVRQKSEMMFCDCGWPYNLIIPRGKKGEGMKFKMIVFISDGTNDLVPFFDQCGSSVLCGSETWDQFLPDIRPLGYPFDRPFKNGSYVETFKGLTNVAIRDFRIVWTDDDFPE
ncbi:10701_t:CDS:2, partial [Scutellospora calospora]